MPFHCKGCHREVGYTDGRRLYYGAMIFPIKVTFLCGECLETNIWRPVA